MKNLPTHTTRGVVYMIISLFIFATVNALVKDVMTSYPVMQVIFLRFFLALIPISFMIYQNGGLKTLKTSNIKKHLFCGCLAVFDLVMLFEAFKKLPLADVNAFVFSTILFITLLSYPLLKEPVGVHRWLAVLVGFGGVLVMANPSGAFLNSGVLLCLLFAFGDALMMIFARLLSRTDQSSTIVFYCCTVASIISGCFLPFVWITPSFVDFCKLAFLGIGAGSAQLLLTTAYRHAQASQIAPVIYTSILWSAFYGYYFWGEIPSQEALMGALLIIIAGLYLVYWENKQNSSLQSLNTQEDQEVS